MTGISTHVLDTATGRPAAGVAVVLLHNEVVVVTGRTDADGRWTARDGSIDEGAYALVFTTGEHFGGRSFHPQVRVDFTVADGTEHHHVPLLVSPYGYTTYRGS